jgi:hypothetical protein
MPPIPLVCLDEDLTAFLPGQDGDDAANAPEQAPSDLLLGKILQFDSIDPNAAESLIFGRRR